MEHHLLPPPVLADLNGDGHLEVSPTACRFGLTPGVASIDCNLGDCRRGKTQLLEHVIVHHKECPLLLLGRF